MSREIEMNAIHVSLHPGTVSIFVVAEAIDMEGHSSSWRCRASSKRWRV